MPAVKLPETILQAWGPEAAQDFIDGLEKRLYTATLPISAFVARQRVNVLVAERASNLLLANEPSLAQIAHSPFSTS